MKFFIQVLFLSLFGIASAQAAGGSNTGFIVNPGLMYSSLKTDSGSVDLAATDLALRLGWGMSNGLYLGVGYASFATKSGSTTTTDTFTSADLGWLAGNWSFVFNYYFSGKDQQDSTTTNIGTGMGLTLGYTFWAGGFGFGPQLSWAEIKYDKKEVSGAESALSPEVKTTGIKPMFGLWFKF
jgi:hypothetical protein